MEIIRVSRSKKKPAFLIEVAEDELRILVASGMSSGYDVEAAFFKDRKWEWPGNPLSSEVLRKLRVATGV